MTRRALLIFLLMRAPFLLAATEVPTKKKRAKSPWQTLTAADRSLVQERWQKFVELPPARQEELRQAWQRLRRRTQAQRAKMRRGLARWNNLEEGQRESLRSTYGHWKGMSPSERRLERNTIMRGRKDSSL